MLPWILGRFDFSPNEFEMRLVKREGLFNQFYLVFYIILTTGL